MNYVKKLLKANWLLIVGIFILISALAVLLILYFRNTKTLEFFTVQQEYYIEFEENTYLKTSVKCSRKDTMYLDKELVSSVSIYDNNTKEEYLLDLVEINKLDLYEYNDKNYYDYELKLLIPFKSDSLISLENCYMSMNYINDETLDFKIGKVFLYNKDSSVKAFTISSLKGLVTTINEEQTLSGVILSLTKEYDNLTIINIETLNNNVIINKGKITELEHTNYESTTPINDVLGYEYNIYNQPSDKNINYNVDKNLIFLLPLSYLNQTSVSTLGFKITYIMDNTVYHQVIEPFMFFKSYLDFEVDFFVYDIN